MKRMLFPLLCGALLFTTSGCKDLASRLLGVWTFDLEATRQFHPESWPVPEHWTPPGYWPIGEKIQTIEFKADGTYLWHTPQDRMDLDRYEMNYAGRWKIVDYELPLDHPDSLDRFLADLPENHQPYYSREHHPEHQLAFHRDYINGRLYDDYLPDQDWADWDWRSDWYWGGGTSMVVILELSPDRLLLQTHYPGSIWVYKRVGD